MIETDESLVQEIALRYCSMAFPPPPCFECLQTVRSVVGRIVNNPNDEWGGLGWKINKTLSCGRVHPEYDMYHPDGHLYSELNRSATEMTNIVTEENTVSTVPTPCASWCFIFGAGVSALCALPKDHAGDHKVVISVDVEPKSEFTITWNLKSESDSLTIVNSRKEFQENIDEQVDIWAGMVG